MKGKLYLIPTPLAPESIDKSIPQFNSQLISSLKYFVVENLRTARRFLKQIDKSININELIINELNEHTPFEQLPGLLSSMLDGNDTGLLSEAGLPCVADPGSQLVGLAHEAGIEVVPLAGPTSILMALMASGFNGQNFTFHGYLPVDKKALAAKIKSMEMTAFKLDQTQIFMEAPYRNNQMLDTLFNCCSGDTRLCIAVDISGENEHISTRSLAGWKKQKPDIHKRPAIFLISK